METSDYFLALTYIGPVRVRRFPHDTLRRLEEHHPDLSHALLGGIAQGLAGKVKRDNG